jgi:hypothetical protein
MYIMCAQTVQFASALAGNSFETWVIRGTRLGLHRDDGTLQLTEVIDEPASYIYAGGAWGVTNEDGGGPSWTAGQHLNGCDLQAALDFFLTAPKNPKAGGNTPAQLAAELTELMETYIAYADSGFRNKHKDKYVDARGKVEDTMNKFTSK